MGCFVQGRRNGMGCFVPGDKNSMGCFVRGVKCLWDVLTGVSKNGMGCFVLGCFVLHSRDFIANTFIVTLYLQQVIKQQRQNILYIFMHL